MRVAFVGLGNMGAPMAANLVKAGHQVIGFDVTEAGRAAGAAAGATIAASQAEAVTGAEALITMLPNGAIARDVWGQCLGLLAPGALAVDCSTIDLASARELHAAAQAAGVKSVDAPVSGGVGGAAAATLTFMCGGDEAAHDAAAQLLGVMGKKIVRCGGPGMGQAAKICNNMVLGVSMIAICEAFALADRMGLDRQAMFDVVSTSSGSCWSINTYCPAPGVGPATPADNDYKPGFAAALMLKDLKLSQDAAADVGAATPMGKRATEYYEQFVNDGNGGKDFSAVILALAAAAGKDA